MNKKFYADRTVISTNKPWCIREKGSFQPHKGLSLFST
jgi:hypothetical protein